MTGWPPHLLQDDSRKLSDWFASRVDARWTVRQVCAEIERTRIMTDHFPDTGKKVREDFEAWWRARCLKTFPKDYSMERLDRWGSAYKPDAHDAYQAATQHSAARIAELEAEVQALRRDATPIPAHELVTMYDERPTSDLEMIEFAREVERCHGIGIQPQHITDGSPCWCNPDVAYTDPETGASAIVHRRPQ